MTSTLPEHVGGGGLSHANVCAEYEHMPPEQVPIAAYVRRVVLLKQSAAGGELQLTLAHGSGLHWFDAALQPKGQPVSVGAYEQVPPLQVPAAENVRRVVALRHTAAGGVLHEKVWVP